MNADDDIMGTSTMTETPDTDASEEYYPEFRTVRRGYDPDQVEQVLDDLYASLNDAVRDAEHQAAALRSAQRSQEELKQDLADAERPHRRTGAAIAARGRPRPSRTWARGSGRSSKQPRQRQRRSPAGPARTLRPSTTSRRRMSSPRGRRSTTTPPTSALRPTTRLRRSPPGPGPRQPESSTTLGSSAKPSSAPTWRPTSAWPPSWLSDAIGLRSSSPTRPRPTNADSRR